MTQIVGKVVLDTNVLVSAVLFGGPPGRLVELARACTLRGVTSLYILDEFNRVLCSPKFGIEAATAEALAVEIAGFTEVVAVEWVGRSWTADAGDDPIVESALVAGATHVVTGDRRLLQASVPGLQIVNVTELLAMIDV